MTRTLQTLLLAAVLIGTPAAGLALSAVFNGDPVNPATGLPYEILPGFPLVLPGADGIVGTLDDVIDSSTVGDIDMVVRSGAVAATAAIPAPTARGGRGALPVGIAGSTAGGGTEIPFTVFLSDGVTSAAAPAGHLLAATDLDNIPVVVSAFADLDGDGFIGPTDQDAAGAADDYLEVRELEPVGRGAALFSGGVARGSLAVRVGRPVSQGSLTIALAAMALTGPFDPNFFGGNIPSGPGISTALPFFPQRDLNRLIRDRAVPTGPNTTLQEVVQFTAIPVVGHTPSFALRLDGSSATIDVAVVSAQVAVRAAFREELRDTTFPRPVEDLILGTQPTANRRSLRLVPVDRWDNPADPSDASTVRLRATGPLQILRPTFRRSGPGLRLSSARGIRVIVAVPRGTTSGSSGALTIERNGIVVGALPYRVDARANRKAADLQVPSRGVATIQAAVDSVSDRNHDGALVIAVRPGLYRENVRVNRSVALRGDDAAATIVQGDGSTNVLTIDAANASIQGLTAVGGSSGFAMNGASAQLVGVRAWHNLGAGMTVAGSTVQVFRSTADGNGTDGLSTGGANALACVENDLLDNGGAGASLSGAQNGLLDGNRIADNAAGGLTLTSVSTTTITDNVSANNLGGPASLAGTEDQAAGITLTASQNNHIEGNLVTLNDADGLHLDKTSSNLVIGNSVDANHGYGMFVRRSTDDDFGAAAGVQPAPGDNTASNNRKGDVFLRAK